MHCKQFFTTYHKVTAFLVYHCKITMNTTHFICNIEHSTMDLFNIQKLHLNPCILTRVRGRTDGQTDSSNRILKLFNYVGKILKKSKLLIFNFSLYLDLHLFLSELNLYDKQNYLKQEDKTVK